MTALDIMDARTSVNVRDMLCAQALAVVARAVDRLADGEALDVLYSTEDVKRDLLVWARDRGHQIGDSGSLRLRIERRSTP